MLRNPDGLSVARLDDGGYRIVGTPVTQWQEAMSAVMPLADAGLAEGDTVHLATFGIEPDNGDGIGAYVCFDDESGRVLCADYGTGAGLEVPEGANRMRCGISTPDAEHFSHVDAVVRPMLVKAEAPVGYYVPYDVGGGIPELTPDEMTVTGAEMELEKVGPRTWRYHGVPERDYQSAYADLELGPGAYMLSCEFIAMTGNGYAQIVLNNKYVQVSKGNPSAKRFEVETAGRRRLEFMARYGGEPLDMTFRPSLVRLGDAGGGIANLVGPSAGVRTYVAKENESVEVTADGVRYAVSNGWEGAYFTVDLEAGAYRCDRDVCKLLIASVRLPYAQAPNDYYSKKSGMDIWSTPNDITVELPGDGRIGFSMPDGEGVAHPSIVRLL